MFENFSPDIFKEGFWDEKDDKMPLVYFTKNITRESLCKLYDKLGRILTSNIAVKVHSGEPGNQNFIPPEFYSDIMEKLRTSGLNNPVIVECNTAYEGERNTTDKHKKVLKDHGWTMYPVDIMDEDGDMAIPTPAGSKYLQQDLVGKHLSKYQSMLVISHYKGHPMSGCAGALKNISIGVASATGKRYIHGVSMDDMVTANTKTPINQFQDSMAEAAGAVHHYFDDGNRMVFINIMKNLSVDCDCCSEAEDPCMADIGVLISTDPVAIDQACLDLIYNSSDPGKDHLIKRIESKNGARIIDTAVKLGYGSKNYRLVDIDTEEETREAGKEEEVETESYLVEDVLPHFEDVINTSDKLIFFGEDANDTKLRQMLYNSRMKTRKEQLLLYEKVKKDNPWIKYTYPDLKKYNSRNVYIDTHYYMSLFFSNNNWTLKKGMNLFTRFMDRLINNPILKDAGYTHKTILFPVNDWGSGDQLWNYRVSLNPLSIIYQFMFTGDLASLVKIFGDNDVLFLGRDNFFKVNFTHIDKRDAKKFATKFKIFIVKLAKNEEFDSEDIDTTYDHNDSPKVVQAKIADDIEDARGVDITPELVKARKSNAASLKNDNGKATKELNKADKNTKAIQKKADEKEAKANDGNVSKLELNKSEKDKSNTATDSKQKVANAIVQATDGGLNFDDALDQMDTTDIRNMLLDISDDNGDKVDISAGRAARMDALSRKFMDANVKGRTVRDILADTSNKEVVSTDIPVSTPNQEWSNMAYMNFDKNYDIDKDVLSCFKHFENVSRPISVKKVEVTDNSTSEDRVELYRVQMEDYRGKQFTVKLDIPIMEDNRFLLRGNYKSIQTQFFNMPIIKTDLDTCQIISNYMKIFLRRFRSGAGRSLPMTAKLIKALQKYTGRDIKIVTGDNLRVCNKYDLPIDYIDLATVFSTIETNQTKFYFNQDQLRSEYQVDDSKGLAIGYNKKEQSIIYLDDNSAFIVSSWIINTLKEDAPAFEALFDASSRPTICTYSRASIMSSQIPLIVICGYHEGLRSTMDKAAIDYTIKSNLTKEDRADMNLDWIKFSDGYVVFTSTYESSLLMNGLKECDTKDHSVSEIDDRNMYLEFLDNFGGRIKADGLDNFYDLMVDPMIRESLEFYKLPTDYISILIYANNLLADNKFIKHTNTSSRKLRRYELIAVYTYKVLADAYAQYANQVKHATNSADFIVKQSAVIDKFLTDTITSDDSVINALRDVETTNAITTKGPSGMNEDRSYSLDKRTYDDSMLNIVAMSTGFAGNVGISRQATLNSNITPEGYVKPISGDVSKMNDANSLSATEALTPFGSTHDDPMRTAMTFVQSAKHGVRTVDSDPLLVTNGADEALAYITTDRFAYKAKGKGTIEEVTDDYIIVKYDNGKSDYINLTESIEKNSDGGYHVPLKIDAIKGLKAGMKVKENQILAYDKESFSNSLGESNNLAYNIGKLAKVAVINSDEGFEDSGIISQSMAQKLATRVDYCFDVKLSKDALVYQIAKVGDHIEAGQELLTWQNPFEDEDANDLLKVLGQNEVSELGKRKLLAGVTGTLKGIKIYRTAEIAEMSNSLQKIVKEYEKSLNELEKKLKEYDISTSNIPAHYKLPATGKMKKSEDMILIEFYVEYLDTIGVGEAVTA